MKKYLILLSICFGISAFALSQSVGIGTTVPNSSAQLDITSTGKGILIPRMNTAAISSISNPAKGLLVYDSSKNQLMVNMGTSIAPNWQTIVSKSGWNLAGNSGTNPATNFIGTTDAAPLIMKVKNAKAGFIDTGTNNTGLGFRTLDSITTGIDNLALGYKSLASNSSGIDNSAVGTNAMLHNTTGSYNTASGYSSLNRNVNGRDNAAFGDEALFSNSSGSGNIAVGHYSLYYNLSGNANTSVGEGSLFYNIGHYNTGVGYEALYSSTTSQYNTAVGCNAGIGFDLGYNNTLIGANCNVNLAGLYNCIAVGQGVICTANSQAIIGNSATNSIGGYANWTNFSDGRYKINIQENVKGLDFIMKLHPVTYQLDVQGISSKLNESRGREIDAQWKQSITEKEKIIFSGFIAQEVEKAAMESGYDFSGVDAPKNENDFYGLRYGDFVVPLVKTVQEQEVIIQQQRAVNDNQQQTINDLQKRLQSLEDQMKVLLQSSIHKN